VNHPVARRTVPLFAWCVFNLLWLSPGYSAPLRRVAAETLPSNATRIQPDTLLPVTLDTTKLVLSQAPAAMATTSSDAVGTWPRDAQGRISTYTVAPGVTWHYDKPRPFRWLLHIPRDLGQFPSYAFRHENKSPLLGLAVSTAVLWAADQSIIDWSQQFGRYVNLKAKSTQRNLVRVPFRLGSANLPFEFNVPDNLNSTFYYLGDGWTHLSIATGFWLYGGLRKDNRALQTSSQLAEAILSSGLVVQALKRSTGRQSPFVATKARGEWHLFPSYRHYQNAVPKHDAFPSGHLATAMATVTVIADNYPERRFIRPLGYSLMGLLGYSMLNNGVHWASDYPLGLALGYAFAKIAVRNGRTRVAPAPAAPGTGLLPPPKRQPWYRQGTFAPYTAGPFTGASWSLRW
jgi:membrane-associated phospholipid phosphatase